MSQAFNLGCADVIYQDGDFGFDRWRNIDNHYTSDHVENVDLRYDKPLVGVGADFALVNHVLCTMKPQEVDMFLRNTYDILKEGATIEVIDVDMLKAFATYFMDNGKDLPIDKTRDKDYRLCMHLSGFGTRLSLYTPQRLLDVVEHAGFKLAYIADTSLYDTRPRESLVVRATK